MPYCIPLQNSCFLQEPKPTVKKKGLSEYQHTRYKPPTADLQHRQTVTQFQLMRWATSNLTDLYKAQFLKRIEFECNADTSLTGEVSPEMLSDCTHNATIQQVHIHILYKEIYCLSWLISLIGDSTQEGSDIDRLTD